MAKRKYNYQPKTRALMNRMEIRKEERIIKKVEKIEEKDVQKLKITTTNGTQCIISKEDEEYENSPEMWNVLYEYLAAGDKVEISSYAGKIIACEIEFSETYYWVTDFQKSDSEVSLTLKDKEKQIKVKITKADIEEEKMICEDSFCEKSYWDEIYNAEYMVMNSMVRVITISERVVFLHFHTYLS